MPTKVTVTRKDEQLDQWLEKEQERKRTNPKQKISSQVSHSMDGTKGNITQKEHLIWSRNA